MIDIVIYQWGDFCKPEHVEILYAMCKRHIHCEFRFNIFTDNHLPYNIKSRSHYRIFTQQDYESGSISVRCYRRLWLFSKKAKEHFPDKIVLLDLDIVICKDITDIITTDVEFAAYNKGHVPYQGAFIILKPGSRTKVWDEFDINTSPELCRGYPGSDQAWLSYILPPGEKVFTKKDGFYCYDVHRLNQRQILPERAKIVFFRNVPKPWMIRDKMWIRQHYRL